MFFVMFWEKLKILRAFPGTESSCVADEIELLACRISLDIINCISQD